LLDNSRSAERAARLVLAALLVGGAILRLWGISGGIPYALAIDEPQIMARSVGMMRSGDFNPHFFHYPGFYIYLQLAVSCVQFMYGAATGRWSSLEQAGMEDFVVGGRIVTAAFGVLTIFLVYRAGKRIGPVQALAAAALMSVMPNHVRESHYILTDVPTTFFVTLALVLSYRAYERGTATEFMFAGAAAGLAAASKYNGGLSVIMPVLAAYLLPESLGRRMRLAGTVVVSCIVLFLVASPYTLLDLPGFLNSFGQLAASLGVRGEGAESGAVVYLKHLRLNMGTPGVLLALAGLAIAVSRSRRVDWRLHCALLTVFPLLYFIMISEHSLIFARYLLPAVPFACLLAGIAATDIAAWLQRQSGMPWVQPLVTVTLVVIMAVPQIRQAVGFNRMISAIGTQRLAYEWIEANVPKGSDVVVEATALLLPSNRYRVHQVRRVVDRAASRVVNCAGYVVASSLSYAEVLDNPTRSAPDYEAYRDFFQRRVELASFQPSPERPGPELKILKYQPSEADLNACR